MALTKAQKLEKINNNFELWCKNFCKIIDNEGKEVKFILNPEQKDFLKNMGKYNLIGKSRQIGFSTLALAYACWLAVTKPNTNCLIVSYEVESTQYLFSRLKSMYENIPDEYKPRERKNNKYELSMENNSKVMVKTAGYKSLGRSLTLQFIHLSEFAFYNEEQQTNGLVSLEQSLAKNPNSCICIESTSNGYNGWQRLFMSAWKGHSKYKAFFYPFYCESTKRQFKSEIDEAVMWHKEHNSGRDRLDDKDMEPDEIELHKLGVSKRLLMWRRWKLTSMSLEDFQQEFPHTPESSFKSTARSVFDVGLIAERQNYILPPLQKQDIEKELPQILLPYLNKGFFMFKNVKQGEKYYGGVDTASGANGGDNSAISIFNSQGEQVCVFFDNDTPVYKFARICNELGRYFDGGKGYCFMAIEKNSYGLGVIERLRQEYHYMNMLKQKVFDSFGKKKLQLGYMTTKNSKAKLINDYDEAFSTGMILINDSNTLDEMKVFVNFEGGKMGNKNKNNLTDDLVIASALAIQAMSAGKWYL